MSPSSKALKGFLNYLKNTVFKVDSLVVERTREILDKTSHINELGLDTWKEQAEKQINIISKTSKSKSCRQLFQN